MKQFLLCSFYESILVNCLELVKYMFYYVQMFFIFTSMKMHYVFARILCYIVIYQFKIFSTRPKKCFHILDLVKKNLYYEDFFSSGAVEMQKVMKTTSKSDSKYFQKCLFITALSIQ
jgi:hypothetical protein